MKLAWRDGQLGPVPGKEPQLSIAAKDGSLSVLPGTQRAQGHGSGREGCTLPVLSCFEPKTQKGRLQECPQGKTEDGTPGLA